MTWTRRVTKAETRLNWHETATDPPPVPDPVSMFRQAVGEPDPWQRDLLTSDAGRLLICCSRQAGKSQTTAILALWRALAVPDSLVLLCSPSLRQSAELFRKVWEAYITLGRPVLATSSTLTRLELANGSRIVSLPGTEATVRSFSAASLLIVDEAARVPDALIFALRPMLAVSGGRLVALSTPFGRRGWFAEEWHDGEEWERHSITARDVPRIPAAFLAAEERALPWQVFASEYLCQFVDDAASVFRYEDIMAAVDPTVQALVFEEED